VVVVESVMKPQNCGRQEGELNAVRRQGHSPGLSRKTSNCSIRRRKSEMAPLSLSFVNPRGLGGERVRPMDYFRDLEKVTEALSTAERHCTSDYRRA
jgi:hypothetical protein